MSQNKQLFIVSGPTAVGKTAACIALSKTFDIPILSADSRQFYKELNIGTAKPSKVELEEAEHHFIGIRSIEDPLSAGDFEKLALSRLHSIFETKDAAILTGGSGLFLKAVYQGLDQFPDVDENVKTAVDEQLKSKGIKSLLDELETRDPDYFKVVDQSNPRRIMRALEVCRSSGKAYSSFLNQSRAERNFKVSFIQLERPREVLYQRINDRVDLMLTNGLIEEVQSLIQYRDLKALQTVGYSEIFDFLDEKIPKIEAIRLIKRNTRRYAKRQLTWFRNNEDWQIFPAEKIGEIIDYCQNSLLEIKEV